MKISILYFSQTGNTRTMAEVVAEGARAVPGVEVGLFPLDAIDKEFLDASKAVIFGTPTYLASTCWQWKKWFDEPAPCPLGGKLGAVFATANFAQGGADIALQTLLCHMLVKGMLVYSGGGACGSPYTHLGAVALRENFEESKAMFRIFGERVARKALELFPEGK